MPRRRVLDPDDRKIARRLAAITESRALREAIQLLALYRISVTGSGYDFTNAMYLLIAPPRLESARPLNPRRTPLLPAIPIEQIFPFPLVAS